MHHRSEQRHLIGSIGVTVVLGVIGMTIGLVTRSRAILFDGMYNLVDVVITIGSLMVARLISTNGTRRFQFGFWHLEPLIELFGGVALSLSCVYAALTAVADLRSGGATDVEYGVGAIWAALTAVLAFAMAVVMHRAAKRTGSGLVALDARGWVVSGGLSLGLLLGFLAALAMADGKFSSSVKYADGTVLLIVSLALLPIPIRSIWHAAAEVGQIAPRALETRVSAAIANAIASHGFVDVTSYVTKSGRARFVEIHLLAPSGHEGGAVDRLDALRSQIAADIGEDGSHLWLTLSVTSDERWL
ncbi:cation transporter [Lysobacter sp. LF1]|uniref:Cation transporter n=1 Tax=Lysobacter stagni TaxID=3045172 RepID=A0ABT6XL14_9GAMM|nr:cation transporter [Lysobacter sp. LF1]MDI9240721.1 cation transporter [Lysobacter sp. LF1]